MVLSTIEERTLYPAVSNYLQSIGFKSVEEANVDADSPNILTQYDSKSFLIELKIGKPIIGLTAVAQAYDHAKRLHTTNIIILIYPEACRNPERTERDNLQKVALDTELYAVILTENWTECLRIKSKELFEELKERIRSKKIKIDFKTIVNLINSYISDLTSVISKIQTDQLINEVVNKLDLFSSIGEIKNPKLAKKQVINLAAFLLFNQILFYNIYKRKTNESSLPELEEIEDIPDIQQYIDKIIKIGYHSIYRPNIIGHIPTKKDIPSSISDKNLIINTVNELIKAIKLLRAEYLTHDLAGRFFHELIPHEIRKILSAFYTHPVAAELLVGFTIDSWNATIIDPACGSGTLLVAAYRKKQELYKNLYGLNEINDMHRQFIETDLTGIDLMPFASSITAINLTMQRIEEKTNIIRIGTIDSLSLAANVLHKDFFDKGIKISPYSVKPEEGSSAPQGMGYEFYLQPVDIVIMNPPFTDRDKMPKEMRDKLAKNIILNRICGNRINLWGFFLALADLLLKENGKIGAVIPINIARGKATEEIRKYFVNNYYIRYIIKPIKDVAFSEGAAFRDVLLIAEKRKPVETDLTTIIFLEKSIREIKDDELESIIHLNSGSINVRKIRYKDLKENADNLMLFLVPKVFADLLSLILSNPKLININPDEIDIGSPYRPRGVVTSVFITRPFDPSRIKTVVVFLSAETENQITIGFKNVDKSQFHFTIAKTELDYGLRTTTGCHSLYVDKDHLDYVIKQMNANYINFLKAQVASIPNQFPWKEHLSSNLHDCYLVIPRKIRLNSPNTHLISFLSANKLSAVGPSLYYYTSTNFEDLKIKCLFFNSIIALLQMITLKSETLGAGWFELMKSDWSLFKIMDTSKLSATEKNELVLFFEEIKKVEFPSLVTQIKDKFKSRIELDRKILEVLGFNRNDINNLLPKMYDAVYRELIAEP